MNISQAVSENLIELNESYIKELKLCVKSGQVSSKLIKLINQLGKTESQVASDETNIISYKSKLAELNQLESQWNEIGTLNGELLKKLTAAFDHFNEASKELKLAQLKFSRNENDEVEVGGRLNRLKIEIQEMEKWS